MGEVVKYIVEADYFHHSRNSPVNNRKLIRPVQASSQIVFDNLVFGSSFSVPLRPELQPDIDYRIVSEGQWNEIKAAASSVDTEIARLCSEDGTPVEPVEVKLVYVSETAGSGQPISLHISLNECSKLNATEEYYSKVTDDPDQVVVRIVPKQPEFSPLFVCPLIPTAKLVEALSAQPQKLLASVYWNGEYYSLSLFKPEDAERVGEIFNVSGNDRRVLVLATPAQFLKRYGDDVAAHLESGGIVGLQNLGNTCYMNSAIQCLSHCVPLTTWYLSRSYVKDINKYNPLGTEGNLAVQYAHTLSLLWKGSEKSGAISPQGLKKTVGKYCPLFKGYDQHDAQEFIGYLLDGLHEDCNTISRKPYVEKPELIIDGSGKVTVDGYGKEHIQPGAPLAELETRVGENSWYGHRLRNESKIVDLFHGMLKSKVHCLHCQATSITYDPMMYASLTIPRYRVIALGVALFLPGYLKPIGFFIKVDYREEVLYGRIESTHQQLKLIVAKESEQIKGKIVDLVHSLKASDSDDVILTDLINVVNSVFLQDISSVKRAFSSDSKDGRRKRTRRQQSSFSTSSDETSAEYKASLHVVSPKLKKNQFENPEYSRLVVCVDPVDISSPPAINGPSFSPPRRADLISVLFTVVLAFPVKIFGSNSISFQYHYHFAQADNLGHVFHDLLWPAISADFARALGNEDVESRLLSYLKSQAVIQVVRALTPSDSAEMSNACLKFKGNTIIQSFNLDLSSEGNSPKASKKSDSPCVVLSDEEIHGDELLRLDDVTVKTLADEFELRASVLPHLAISVADDDLLTHVVTEDVAIGGEDQFWMSLANEYDVSKHMPADARALKQWLSKNAHNTTNSGSSQVGVKTWKCQLRSQTQLPVFSSRMSNSPFSLSPFMATLEPTNPRLSECLREFIAEEQLEDSNQWYCPKCKDHVPATKKFDFFRLPEILVIHLKRFHQEGYRYRTKISSLVDFPWKKDDYLDLSDLMAPCNSPLTSRNCKYRLFAICNHFGTLSGGHYTARARSFVRGKWEWYIYDDSRVTRLGEESELDESEMVNSSAYVLFYQRVD